MSQVWKLVHKITEKYTTILPPVLSVNGETVADDAAVVKTLIEMFADLSRRGPRPPAVQCVLELEESNLLDISSFRIENYNVPFTIRDVLTILFLC